MEEFTQKVIDLKLSPSLDEEKIENIKNQFDDLVNDLKLPSIFDKDDLTKLKESFIGLKEIQSQITLLKNQIDFGEQFGLSDEKLNKLKSELKELEEKEKLFDKKKSLNNKDNKNNKKESFIPLGKKEDFAGTFKDSFKTSILGGFDTILGMVGDKFAEVIIKVGEKLMENIKKTFDEAWSTLKNMVNQNISTMDYYNSEYVNLYRNYGLTGEEAYAVQGALKKIGFDSLDDIINNADIVNDQMLDKFNDFYEIYKDEYSKSIELSAEMDSFYDEFDVLKENIKESVIQFIVNNKDVIIGALNAVLSIMNGVNSVVAWLTANNDRSNSERLQATYDIWGATNNNSSFIVNNTINGVDYSQPQQIRNIMNESTYTLQSKIYS